VKSVWTPAGPRQRHVCYLGSSYDSSCAEPKGRCEWHGGPKAVSYHFWKSADRKLAEAGITGDELAAIVAGLERVNCDGIWRGSFHDQWHGFEPEDRQVPSRPFSHESRLRRWIGVLE
jgi:hypothetical protein